MKCIPEINEYDLLLVADVLAVMNPGRASKDHIRDCINAAWPFDNISTGGWVAYAESPDKTNTVRVALQPYTVARYMHRDTRPVVGVSEED
jgi:hypothetical protein